MTDERCSTCGWLESAHGVDEEECPCCKQGIEHIKPSALNRDWPIDELLVQAERQGYLLAKVAEDGTLVMSGDETRLQEAYARVRKRMPDAVESKTKREKCDRCDGDGTEPYEDAHIHSTCPKCDGTGDMPR